MPFVNLRKTLQFLKAFGHAFAFVAVHNRFILTPGAGIHDDQALIAAGGRRFAIGGGNVGMSKYDWSRSLLLPNIRAS